MRHALLDTGWWDPKERSWLRTFVKVLLSSGSVVLFTIKNFLTIYFNILITLINILILINLMKLINFNCKGIHAGIE